MPGKAAHRCPAPWQTTNSKGQPHRRDVAGLCHAPAADVVHRGDQLRPSLRPRVRATESRMKWMSWRQSERCSENRVRPWPNPIPRVTARSRVARSTPFNAMVRHANGLPADAHLTVTDHGPGRRGTMLPRRRVDPAGQLVAGPPGQGPEDQDRSRPGQTAGRRHLADQYQAGIEPPGSARRCRRHGIRPVGALRCRSCVWGPGADLVFAPGPVRSPGRVRSLGRSKPHPRILRHIDPAQAQPPRWPAAESCSVYDRPIPNGI
ncbi:hypothetical protein E9229_003944 [Paeniglutamicibacter cryotolerans]|uniref:Uncharacterized protein n=1 Tax=Paeniglutamicibacter cryotolerans TaxID=670079 RepID=A0A839QWI7_9MICC|nr:hypothetical protein [Paeniglutamicibacter cryotolerans]